MTDDELVKRLRAREVALRPGQTFNLRNMEPWLRANTELRNEAADRIEALNAQVAERDERMQAVQAEWASVRSDYFAFLKAAGVENPNDLMAERDAANALLREWATGFASNADIMEWSARIRAHLDRTAKPEPVCPRCNGSGVITKREEFPVKLPPNLDGEVYEGRNYSCPDCPKGRDNA